MPKLHAPLLLHQRAERHQQPALSNNTMESLILFAALFVLVVTKATALAAVVNFVTNT
jgi:hypothetical protein